MPRKALATVAVPLLLTAAVAAFVLVRSGGVAPGSTPKATFRDRDGDGVLERAHGEALVDRTEIGPRSRAVGRGGGAGGGRARGPPAQAGAPAVAEEESPARLEVLDRRGRPFTSAFRPQEAL